LSVLARLRNLSQQTKKQPGRRAIEQMALSYNIKEDAFYQEGQKEREKQIIVKMLKDKTLTIEKIAEIVDVTIDYVKQVAKELKK